MNDWDAMLKVVAKGNGFVGTTRHDEDAYYEAFQDDPQPILPSLPVWPLVRRLLDRARILRVS